MSVAESEPRFGAQPARYDHPELPEEQGHLDRIRLAVDAARRRASVDPRQAAGSPKAGIALARDQQRRLDNLPVDGEVLIGRLVLDDDDLRVGKRTILDEDKEPLCVSVLNDAVAQRWHAPVGSVPDEVLLRRRIAVRVWSVLGLTDEVDRRPAARVEPTPVPWADEWAGDPLMAELERARSAEMRDIVATIQREQFDAMSVGYDRTLVVQGGPGTGKTAVGLHRAAWLVVNDTEPARAGVLVVGPNPAFMTYIRSVLPALGVDAVHQFDVVSLVASSASITAADNGETARVKGSAAMAQVLERALRKRIRPLSRPAELTFNSVRLQVTPDQTRRLVETAMQRAVPYIVGRQGLRDRLQESVWHDYLEQMEAQGRRVSGEDFARLRRLPAFESVLDQVWPSTSAAELIRSLYGMPRRLRAAADGLLGERQQEVLRRRPTPSVHHESWTRADLVLIDETDNLLSGSPPSYGHVVVDEAQDLTPMELRAVARRCSTGQLTLLGDIAQATGPVMPRDWSEITAHLGRTDVQSHELTTGYRVPDAVLDLAAGLLPRAAPSVTPPTSYRTGPAPEIRLVEDEDDAVLEALLAAHRLLDDDGLRTAVIAPASRVDGVVAGGRARGLAAVDGRGGDLDHPVVVLDPTSAKGLEFDAVVVLEPLAVRGETTRGARSLYVVLTRCTQRLVVVTSRALPRELGGSADVPTSGSGSEAASAVDTDLARLLELVSRVPSEDRLLVVALLERFATLAEPAVDGVAESLARRGAAGAGPALAVVTGVSEQR
jgi:hypothetical protein